MWFYRRILRISYAQHVTNERVLERMSAERELIKTIRVQQMKFFGHIMRNKEVENMIITEKIEGKRSQGKQRLTFTKSLSNCIGINEVGTDQSGTGPTEMKSHNLRSLHGTDMELKVEDNLFLL